MNNVYFDEAGNSGFQLLDPVQPVFVLASNCFDESTATEMIKLLNVQKGGEAKFKNFKTSDKGQRKIVEFLKTVITENEKVKVTVYHKKYMAMGLLLNYLVEPQFAERGMNFAANKYNIITNNIFFHLMDYCYGAGSLDSLLSDFIELVKDKSDENIESFYSTVRRIAASPLDLNKQLDFSWIKGSESDVKDHLEHLDRRSLDPVQSGIFTHAQYWGEEFDNSFNIIHDESNTLEQSLDYFNKYTDPSSMKIMVGSDDRIIKLPLKVQKVDIKNSRLISQIQVSDMIAGAIAYYLKQIITGQRSEKLWNELDSIGIGDLLTHMVWPEMKFTTQQYGIKKLDSVHGVNIADEIATYQMNQARKYNRF
ncbi:DUF3800 domain-containing protein (plasmid) [Acinetobacter seifertii]|uniref:DUF3800 domain-containing protein n=1 Tax=Acinetobacter seifertii TaxID=1530123 RepID=A0A7H2SIR4_9GAMM|nr:DUF3800 domain-containing protein [Acinetobacter seifertii]MDV4266090.1 DUF3800 domain-containing protein [Acinetobacter seifertii]QNX14330.1 DUF3800 domain-containing protein [Acinetobacter seifertii]QNX21857.1 DUF3800 domain-containing protein [Acinetobacter seifertii]QNX28550.1 DUF3800 domain-containing protein [Acinetobacter seifertii]QNX39497.1 DUF3800 domain-containing protein [Acinetobacter seifertii]